MPHQAPPQTFFEQGTPAEKIERLKRSIIEAEASLKNRKEILAECIGSLQEMKKQYNKLNSEYKKNPTGELQKQLLQLEVDSKYLQNEVEKSGSQEATQKLESNIAAAKLKLRYLIAQSVLGDPSANSKPAKVSSPSV